MRLHLLLQSWIALMVAVATTTVAAHGFALSPSEHPVPRTVPSTSSPVPSAANATCVRVSAEARYRNFGYDHVVHLENGCDKTAECLVATDVNPQEQRVSVPPAVAADVITFVGSPSRAFTPHVTCTLR